MWAWLRRIHDEIMAKENAELELDAECPHSFPPCDECCNVAFAKRW